MFASREVFLRSFPLQLLCQGGFAPSVLVQPPFLSSSQTSARYRTVQGLYSTQAPPVTLAGVYRCGLHQNSNQVRDSDVAASQCMHAAVVR